MLFFFFKFYDGLIWILWRGANCWDLRKGKFSSNVTQSTQNLYNQTKNIKKRTALFIWQSRSQYRTSSTNIWWKSWARSDPFPGHNENKTVIKLSFCRTDLLQFWKRASHLTSTLDYANLMNEIKFLPFNNYIMWTGFFSICCWVILHKLHKFHNTENTHHINTLYFPTTR